eukprot:4950905-Ditylum_brightwellii.AAC.2
MNNAADRGDCLHLADDRVGMVIAQWKDSKVLQAVSTVMEHGTTTITRCIGQEGIDVICPNDIVLYQHYMGGIDRGDQYHVTGTEPLSSCTPEEVKRWELNRYTDLK